MKSKITFAFLALTGAAFAQTTTWYGVQDNSAAAGATVDGFTAIAASDFHDTMLRQDNPTLVLGANAGIQVSGPRSGGFPLNSQGAYVGAFRFEGLTIADPISSAQFHFRVNFVAGSVPYYITPIAAGAGSWTEGTANWDNLASFIDVSATTDAFTPTATGWMSVDVTSYLQDYLDGTIAGFAFVRNVEFVGNIGDTPYINIDSSDGTAANIGGLSVTTVPEPASAGVVMAAASALALLRRRRRA